MITGSIVNQAGKTKNQYEKHLYMALKRRGDLKANRKNISKEEYTERRLAIQNRITKIYRAIRTFESNIRNLKRAITSVEEFSGYSWEKMRYSSHPHHCIYKRILFKHCMEHVGLSGGNIGKYLDLGPKTVARGRTSLNRSFKTSKENLEMWHRFKDFLKREKV